VCVCLCVLGACLNMREISSFTHSPSLPYCKFVRIRLFFFSSSVISHYSYIQLLIYAFVRFCVCVFVCLCIYIFFAVASFKQSFQNSVHFRCYSPVNFISFVGFFFICSSFQMEIEKSYKNSMSFFQSLSLSLSFSFFCSLFFFRLF